MSGKGPDLEVYSDFGYNDAPYHRPNSQALTKHDIMGYKMLGMWRVTPHLRFIEIKYILSNLLPPNYYKKPTNSKEGWSQVEWKTEWGVHLGQLL